MHRKWTLWAMITAIVALGAGALAIAKWSGRGEPAPAARLPADFEPVGGIVLATRELVEGEQMPLLGAILQGIEGGVPTTLLASRVSDQLVVRNALDRMEIGTSSLRFLLAPHESSRVGEYGPFWGDRPEQASVLIDTPRHAVEQRGSQQVVNYLAKDHSQKIIRLAVYVGRGNLISNGQGVAVTTTALLDQNADLGWDEATLRRTLREALGIKELVFLSTLEGEPSGHAERFVVFTSPDTVAVGQYDPQHDPINAAILDANAKILAQVELSPGTMLRVERIPMPPHYSGQWRSYTPVVFVNQALLVPSFPDVKAALQEQAMATYRRLLPDHKLVPIDARPLDAASATLRSLVLPMGG